MLSDRWGGVGALGGWSPLDPRMPELQAESLQQISVPDVMLA